MSKASTKTSKTEAAKSHRTETAARANTAGMEDDPNKLREGDGRTANKIDEVNQAMDNGGKDADGVRVAPVSGPDVAAQEAKRRADEEARRPEWPDDPSVDRLLSYLMKDPEVKRIATLEALKRTERASAPIGDALDGDDEWWDVYASVMKELVDAASKKLTAKEAHFRGV